MDPMHQLACGDEVASVWGNGVWYNGRVVSARVKGCGPQWKRILYNDGDDRVIDTQRVKTVLLLAAPLSNRALTSSRVGSAYQAELPPYDPHAPVIERGDVQIDVDEYYISTVPPHPITTRLLSKNQRTTISPRLYPSEIVADNGRSGQVFVLNSSSTTLVCKHSSHDS